MIGKVFVDTNLFVYAYTSNDEYKHSAVLELFAKLKSANLHLCVSSQVFIVHNPFAVCFHALRKEGKAFP
jgi:predicted nucleic acid-binding protein